MLLTSGPSFEFIKFIQVFCWIVLPVLLLAVLVTIFFHYRKKRSAVFTDENIDEKLTTASPEQMGFTRGDGEYVLFDHSVLIGKYKNRLSYNHARYMALRRDFEKLEITNAGLARYATSQFLNNKKDDMGNNSDSMPQVLQEEISKITKAAKIEKEEMLAAMDRITGSYKLLEEENQSLQDQLKIHTTSGEEKNMVLVRWIEENAMLKEKVAEQKYVHEVLLEKKAQIDFLQNQLEQRIKNSNQWENEFAKLASELEESKMLHSQKVETLHNELIHKNEEIDKTQVLVCRLEEQLKEKDQGVSLKQEHINRLENALREGKEEQDKINVALASSNERVSSLENQLFTETQKNEEIGQSLSVHKQLFQRMYNELATIMKDGISKSPVISLRTEYMNTEKEDMAVH